MRNFELGDSVPCKGNTVPPCDIAYTTSLVLQKWNRITGCLVEISKPICSIAFLMFAYVKLLSDPALARNIAQFHHTVYYNENVVSSSSICLTDAIYNGLIILGVTFALTVIFIIMYLYNTPRGIWYSLVVLIAIVSFSTNAYWIYLINGVYSLNLDYLSAFIIFWNFSSFELYSILATPTRSRIHQSMLVLLAMQLSWPWTELGHYTVWITLIVFGAYDLLAVLSVCGPLKFIMETIGPEMDEYMPAVLYKTHYSSLGIADMAFYGLLFARASMSGTVVSILTAVAVLSVMLYYRHFTYQLQGVQLTMLLTETTSYRTLPALPLAVVFGVPSYFIFTTTLNGYIYKVWEI